ncbi:DUF1127 domain-containing protein [Caenispirillum bisanense]|uniref:Uncharacterized conserved protein YjiS, DUF1127 family n=1 Tax=Caenispirillum bisanense TaxID=414052 RepID=A0A286GI17_9PROT|nr:DUF1127 domain-containing protein [Caenispirillum bisanense]SOD94624.1 Uncharacterized conserved protein YjiS, DUF1127 family [Caenispirillum bisanense]
MPQQMIGRRASEPIRLPLARRLATAVARLPGAVFRWYVAQQTRLALARLDDRLLRDIGVSREQAADEASQSFWRVGDGLPRDWR